jgi:ribosomal protein S18 acetylase RimI-like enzyme
VALGSFYGSREEPRTPLWGTPAGPAVEWDDSATKKFLARKGFAPRFRALHLAVELAGRTDDFRRAAARSRRSGAELRASAGRVEAVRRGRTAGAVVYFAMPELGPGRCAIHEASVAEAWRAKALPGQLLEGALGRMREEGAANCEALAAPDVDPRGFRLYSKAGFRTVASWAIY